MDCHCHSEGQSTCIELVPIFSSLTKEEMLEVAAIISNKTFQRNEWIYCAGDKGGKLYILRSGRVKISRINANGKEQVIRVVEPGDFMGELSLFSSSLLKDNAEALESSTLCIIEGEQLKELMKKYPSIAFKILEELSQRLERTENLIETINLYSVEQRLAQALIDMSANTTEVHLNMTKGDFASQLGMSHETLSRKLTAFQEEGLIEVKGHRKIIILDRAGLERIILN
ncbi:MAG: Crp/Fnr family transcriptional regulator [Peptococcaceae bacterium]|nr:Crp/Fnr family transcriptional regulator [Peptococcaceae bacterium]